jgi:hypothetical protein
METVIKCYIVYNNVEKKFWSEMQEELVHRLEEATKYISKKTAEDDLKTFDEPGEFEVVPMEIIYRTLKEEGV